MNTVRATILLCYLMIALVIFATCTSIWYRWHDPMWSRMSDVRCIYDIHQISIVVFALAVGYGLWRGRNWGRVYGVSLATIVLFMFVGIRLVAPFITDGEVGIRMDWDVIVMGILSSACIFALCRRKFREEFTANSALKRDCAKARHPIT
jgi:hypothetical protein